MTIHERQTYAGSLEVCNTASTPWPYAVKTPLVGPPENTIAFQGSEFIGQGLLAASHLQVPEGCIWR